MKSNQTFVKAAFLGTALCAVATAQSVHAQILFSNFNSPAGVFESSANEVGDEIVLADNRTGATLTSFSFQFFATNVDTTATYNLFLYANDGGPSPSGPATPSTPLYTDTYNFGADGFTDGIFAFDYASLSIAVPTDFTWAIEFSGLGAGTAGMVLSTNAPAIGQDYTAYWLNLGTSASPNWTLATNADYNLNFLFVASGTANPPAPTPEPSTFALMGMGIAGLAGFMKRNAKR